MLAMLTTFATVVPDARDYIYDARSDLPSEAARERVLGTVPSVSRLRITIQTTGPAPELTSYPTHRRLSQGLCSSRAHDSVAYTTHDVRPGDVIRLYICQEGKTDYCYAISLSSRPGGLVPDSRKPRVYRGHAEVANAFNDWGRPIPRHLQVGIKGNEYPFADADVPTAKRLKRFPQKHPFSYYEYVLFMR